MNSELTQLLDSRFAELGVADKALVRAAFVETDPATFSKILRGNLTLSDKRAESWAAKLFDNEPEGAAEFVERLRAAARARPTNLSVNGFCERIVAEGGAIGAERISELFAALQAPDVLYPLICVEYRDLPRATKAAKYEELGSSLASAIIGGVSFAMFQPFGSHVRFPDDEDAKKRGLSTQSAAAAAYIRKIRAKCRSAYRTFQADVEKLQAANAASDAMEEEASDRKSPGSLQLFERKGDESYLGSGFQAKLFYIEWQTRGETILFRHKRLLQWVSTPKKDLLIYRGESDLDPDAVRDTFYPVPHYFDATQKLPEKLTDKEFETVENDPATREELPQNYRVWDVAGDG
ncbi:MAG TPA: hypothetical protein VF620_02895 [Allosphingosinicella sp.]|jgi:hypothetical protein